MDCVRNKDILPDIKFIKNCVSVFPQNFFCIKLAFILLVFFIASFIPNYAYALLSAPTLYSPADGATGVSTTPTISWSSVAGANRYWLMVATSSSAFPTDVNAISCPVCVSTGVSGTTGSTSHTLPNDFPYGGTSRTLSPNTTYYWKVQAWNTDGTMGYYPSYHSFTTDGTLLPAPTLISPGTGTGPGEEIFTTTPTFRWNSVSGADKYGLYISTYPYGSNYIVYETESISGSLTYFNMPGGYMVEGGKYRWDMRAHNSAGWSDFASDLYFTIKQPPLDTTPLPPTGVSATDGTYTDRVSVTWNSASDATTYEVWRNTSSSSGSAIRLSTTSVTNYDDTTASVGVTYYYWLKAKNSYGTSDFSSYDTGYRSGTALPDLLPYAPAGWSSSLILRTDQGCSQASCSSNNSFADTDIIYVSFGIRNDSVVDINNSFLAKVYVDEVEKKTWTLNTLLGGWWSAYWNWSIGSFAPGQHTIKLSIDTSNSVSESNEVNNEYSFTFSVNSTPDTSPPTITIASPTTSSTYPTSSSSLNIGGTASDDVGVTQVTWSNDRGGSSTASGTTSWSVNGITLQSGTNVITVTARDAANNTGTDTLTVTYNPTDITPPTVTTNAASSITQTSATLNGTVNANGLSTTAWFEYGIISGSYSDTTSTRSISGSDDTEVSETISELSEETTYYYRIAAQNSVDTTYGDEKSFTTGTSITTRVGYPGSIWKGPAADGNFEELRGSYTKPSLVILHTIVLSGTGWQAEAALSEFKTLGTQVSAHYIVKQNGEIWQVVSDQDTAYHAGNFDYNQRSIGIEMEGWADGIPDSSWQTSALYTSLQNLISWLSSQYNFSLERDNIIGHNQVPGVDNGTCAPSSYWGGCSGAKTDPGPYWNWIRLMKGLGQTVNYSTLTVQTSCSVLTLPQSGAPSFISVWPGQQFVAHDFIDGYYLLSTSGQEATQPGYISSGEYHWDGWISSSCVSIDSGLTQLEVTGVFPGLLNIRNAPSTTGTTILAQTIDGKRYVASGNIQDADGYTWREFYIPSTDSIITRGWAISDNLNTIGDTDLISIEVTPANPTITLGNTQQFTATGNYQDGSIADITTTVTWSSSDTFVATIDTIGLATSHGIGTANITASLNNITSPASTLTVTQEGSDDNVLSVPVNFSATVEECNASGTSCTVSLSWIGVSAATGYKLYYGYSSGSYEAPVDLGNVTSVTFPGVPGGTYYLAISAYDSSVNESNKSEEIVLFVGESSVPTNFNTTVSDCIEDVFGNITSCTVTLSWTGVSGSAGYYLYYGFSSDDYVGSIDVGNVTSVTYTGIADGIYYLALTAYDSGGVESDYSDELILEVGSNSVNKAEKAPSPFAR